MDCIRRSLPPPDLGKWNIHGQRDIDQLHGRRDQVEIICNLLHCVLGDIITKEGPTGQGTVDFTKHGHAGVRLRCVRFTGGNEFVEVCGKNLFLDREVGRNCLVGKQRRQSPAVLGMGLPLKKHPCLVTEKILRNGDDTGLGVGRRLKDLMGDVSVRGQNHELVED